MSESRNRLARRWAHTGRTIPEGRKNSLRVKVLFSGVDGGIGAATKRVQNYKHGLATLGVEVEVLAFGSRPGRPLGWLATPLGAVANLLKTKGRSGDVWLIYGFGWVGKLLLVLLGKLRRTAIVFEVNEKPYSIRESGRRDVLLRHLAPFNYWCLTRLVFPLADGFVVISEPLRQIALRYSSKAALTIKIPIIVDLDYYSEVAPVAGGIEGPCVVHAATVNDVKDGVLSVLEAVAIVHRDYRIPVHLYFANRTGLQSVLESTDLIIRENNLEPFVHFLSSPGDEVLARYQASCDLTIINKTDTDQNRHNFASKIGEFLALGKPIITTRIGEVTTYLEDNKSCLFVDPNEPDQIAEKVVLLLNSPQIAAEIGSQGRVVAGTHFSRDVQARRLMDFLESVAGTGT